MSPQWIKGQKTQRMTTGLPDIKPKIFFAIDFDGTVAPDDITDAVIRRFAGYGWQVAEELWVHGLIGSRACLERQISLIDAPLSELLTYIDSFSLDQHFPEFVHYLENNKIPFAIISDGFRIFTERLLKKSGLERIPVYANELKELRKGLRPLFPHAQSSCQSGTCKCMVSRRLGKGLPVILIGDGRSDFGLADMAAHVFSKGRLSVYCEQSRLPYTPFDDFKDIKNIMIEMPDLIFQCATNNISLRI